MSESLTVRAMTDAEAHVLRELAHSRTAQARLRDRARVCWLSHQGQRVAAIKASLGIADGTVRLWITRFNAEGLDGLRDRRRGGRPATYTPEQVGESAAASLTNPQDLGLPFASWTLDRLTAYLNEERGIAINAAASARSCTPRVRVGADKRPGSASGPTPPLPQKGGHCHPRHTTPMASLAICFDQMGARQRHERFPGSLLVCRGPRQKRRLRAKQEIDYGRRGRGYVFGAFVPATREGLHGPLRWALDRELRGLLGAGGDVARSHHRTRLRGVGQPGCPPRPGCAAVGAGSPPLGVRLSTEVRCLPEPDRAVVEGVALLGAQGAPVCYLAGGLPGG